MTPLSIKVSVLATKKARSRVRLPAALEVILCLTVLRCVLRLRGLVAVALGPSVLGGLGIVKAVVWRGGAGGEVGPAAVQKQLFL